MLSRSFRHVRAPISTGAKTLAATSNRPYFSMMDRIRSTVTHPWRHIKSFIEPDGQNYESQLPDGYRLHGNTAANLSATITHNALEMNQWHDMEATVHS